MDDLDHLSRIAVKGAWARGSDVQDRYEAAWDAIAEALIVATEPPSRSQLVHAAWAAINEAAQADIRHRGGTTTNGTQPVAFERFWRWAARTIPSPETGVVEALALTQIWPHLTSRQRDCLLALAVTGDYRAGSEMVGLDYHSFHRHVRHARARVFALWHEGETPSRVWTQDRRRWRADVEPSAERRPVTIRTRAARRRLAKDRLRREVIS